MNQYRLIPRDHFKRKYTKLVKNNSHFRNRIQEVFEVLMINPFFPSLKTHKVNTKIKKGVYSSSISGDLRIIWEFNENEINIIDLLDIGGHSGSKGVYK
ncbi:MAG: type II toxin-antitoxin system mRNA interferase toxin, RelE/StbE family [bacterium]